MLNKYLKCSVWRLALLYDIYMSLGFKMLISIYYYSNIQPLGQFGQRPELSQATGMVLVRCILGKFLGVFCHCFPPVLNISVRNSYLKFTLLENDERYQLDAKNVIYYHNTLKPNDLKMRRTAQLTSRCCILYIYSTNISTEYFKHAA